MAINKVEYNGEVLMDLTEDTVTEETLASGVTAHNAAGEPITGTMTSGGVQSDWAQTDETQLDYIKNKPKIKSEAIKDDSSLITSGGVYDAIQNISKPYTAGNLIKIENGVISSTLGDEYTVMQETQVLETNYFANGDNTTMPPFYIWQYLDNPVPFVVDDKVYLYCADSSGNEQLVGEGVMEQNASIDVVLGDSTHIGCKFNISSSWSDLFGLSTGMPIINPIDSSITINGNVAQFIFLQVLNFPNMVVFGAAQDYPNIKFRVSKDMLATVYVKLPNEALTFDDMPIDGSENLITSGGVYEAIESGREIVYIPTELGFNENGVPTTATLIGVTHADILDHIEQGKEPKLKVFSEVIGLQSGLLPLVFHGVDDTLMFQATMPIEPYWIINVIVTQNDTTLQTVQNLNSGSIVDENVDDITNGWNDYIPTVGASKRLISAMTNKILKPFEVVATVDFQNNTLINVRANEQSQTEADIYQLIADAYDNDYHCYMSGNLSQMYYGHTGFLQLTVFSSDAAVFEQVIDINNKYYHMKAVIMPGNVFVFTTTELINEEQIFAEIQRIEEIANGKCQSFVFDTQLKLETEIENYKNNELSEGDILYNIELKIGDIFLIKDTEVPDYWWNGNGISELETTNIDPNNYYTKTENDQILTYLATQFNTELAKKQDIRNIQLKANAGTEVRYYRLGLMAIDDGNNYGNFTFTGRLGGWTNDNTAVYSIMLMNRGDYTGNVITATVSASGEYNAAIGLTDIVVAKNIGLSHTVYLKVTGYFCYNFDWTAYQHLILYDETYVTTEPNDIIWKLSEAPKTILKSDGSFEASGGINATTIDGKQIVTSNSAPASGTSENIITLVY